MAPPPDTAPPPDHVPSDDELRRRKSRSVALGLVLGGLALLFFIVTLAKLGGNVVNRPL